MSSSDLFTADYPHGTPTGYDQGCRGGACPGAAQWGLSCKLAKQFSRSDYPYQKLAKAGWGPADIADKLGLIPTATPAKPDTKHATPRKPTDRAALAKALATPPAAWQAVAEAENTVDEQATPAIDEQSAVDEEPAIATAPTPAPTTPKQIRAWAAQNGHTVNAKGTIPKHIVEQYWDAHDPLPEIQPPAINEQPVIDEDTTTPQVDTSAPNEDSTTLDPDATTPLQHIPGPRPDWAHVTLTEDLESARSLAARLWDELATAEQRIEQLELAEIDHCFTAIESNQLVARLREERDEARRERADLRASLEAAVESSELVARLAAERDRAREQLLTAITTTPAHPHDQLIGTDRITITIERNNHR